MVVVRGGLFLMNEVTLYIRTNRAAWVGVPRSVTAATVSVSGVTVWVTVVTMRP